MLGNGTCVLPQLVTCGSVVGKNKSTSLTHGHHMKALCTVTTALQFWQVLMVSRSPALKLSILASHRPEDQVQPNQNHAGNLNPDHLRSPDDPRSSPYDDLQAD